MMSFLVWFLEGYPSIRIVLVTPEENPGQPLGVILKLHLFKFYPDSLDTVLVP
jgi:hypothetical protein